MGLRECVWQEKGIWAHLEIWPDGWIDFNELVGETSQWGRRGGHGTGSSLPLNLPFSFASISIMDAQIKKVVETPMNRRETLKRTVGGTSGVRFLGRTEMSKRRRYTTLCVFVYPAPISLPNWKGVASPAQRSTGCVEIVLSGICVACIIKRRRCPQGWVRDYLGIHDWNACITKCGVYSDDEPAPHTPHNLT